MAAQTPRGNNVKANKVEEKDMNAKDSHLKCRPRLEEQRRAICSSSSKARESEQEAALEILSVNENFT